MIKIFTYKEEQEDKNLEKKTKKKLSEQR